jgi:hypothetical protein
MLFKAVKNIKLDSVKISRGIKRTLQADFFKGVSDGFTKGALQSDRITDPGLKNKKDGKDIGALFKPEPDKKNNIQFNK